MYKSNTSGVRGVYYNPKRGKWIAQIMFKQKCYYLGGFDKIEDAAEARAEAEEKIFGDFLKWYKDKHSKKNKKYTPDDVEMIITAGQAIAAEKDSDKDLREKVYQ